MGIVRSTHNSSQRVAKHRARVRRAAAVVSTDITSNNRKTEEFLRKFPIEMRLKILKKGVTQATRAVVWEVRDELAKQGPLGGYKKLKGIGQTGRKRSNRQASPNESKPNWRRSSKIRYETGKPIGRSSKTGTWKKWSSKASRRMFRRWDMHKGAGTKIRTYDHGRVILGMAGFRARSGSQAWILEHGGNIKLWGGKQYRLKKRPFLKVAGKRSLPAQKRAIRDKLKKEWQNL